MPGKKFSGYFPVCSFFLFVFILYRLYVLFYGFTANDPFYFFWYLSTGDYTDWTEK